MAQQPLSKKASCSNTRFGKSERETIDINEGPGPGTYDIGSGFTGYSTNGGTFTFGTGHRASFYINGDKIDN
jgi:hypothetical protein